MGLKELLSQLFAWRGREGGLLCFLSKQTLNRAGGGQKKNECLGGVLKSPCLRYLAVGLTMFLVKKDCKMKYGFEG